MNWSYVALSLAEDIGGKLFMLCGEDDWKELKISNLGQRLLKKLKEKVDTSIMNSHYVPAHWNGASE